LRFTARVQGVSSPIGSVMFADDPSGSWCKSLVGSFRHLAARPETQREERKPTRPLRRAED
jgi:hypothetical protein